MTAEFTEEFVQVGESRIRLLKGGSGEPLLIFHGIEGNPGWLHYVQALSDRFTVYLPSHPGFGGSECPQWLSTLPDLACFYTWFQEEHNLEGVRAIGLGMGGWLAAEMAVMCHHAFSRLMLVDAAGIKPRQGEITDIFIISPEQIRDLTFHDPGQVPEYQRLYGQALTPEQQNAAEGNREMAVRLCWKPYMFDPRLPSLLARTHVPTRIVWGRQDRIIPLECGELYKEAIPGSELVVIDNCGHSPQIERPEEFVKTGLDFFG